MRTRSLAGWVKRGEMPGALRRMFRNAAPPWPEKEQQRDQNVTFTASCMMRSPLDASGRPNVVPRVSVVPATL